MTNLDANQQNYLKKSCGDRVSFDETERMLYGHDISTMPSVFKPLIGKTIPDAVVQPTSEEKLIDIVSWANKHHVPITPRGKATSGYGGVLPVKQGMVVDFHQMQSLLSVDKKNNTCTVQPGISWEKLDIALKKQGMTLRLYPTSYLSSTVGGWLAQGGAGIGSYEYGWFSPNVESVRVVLPTSEVREFSGDDIGLIADAEGITGLISSVTLKIQPFEELDVVALQSPDAASLQAIFEKIIAEEIPLWNVNFINPKMAELRNRAPPKMHNGHAEEGIMLPLTYNATLTFRKKDRDVVMSKLEPILRSAGIPMMDERIAHHEWENRFSVLLVKRLGPSLVPVEFVIPFEELGATLSEIDKKVNQPFISEGIIIRKGVNGTPEVVILGFIPGDERKFNYNLLFGLVLSIFKIAEKHNGRPYSTGLYFGNKMNMVLGKERAKKIKQFKAEIDPNQIMNPGKVLNNGIIGTALSLGNMFEPMIRPLGNTVTTDLGVNPTLSVRGIPADIVWSAYSCAQCGFCVEDCTQFYGRGWESQSARGKWYWLREYIEGRVEWNQKMIDSFLSCTTCERCNVLRCPLNLPIEPSWLKMRGKLVTDDGRMTFPPLELMAASVSENGNIWANERSRRADWFPEDLKAEHGPGTKAKNVYFAGCTASYVENDVGIASARLLHDAGVDYTYLGKNETCCATPMLAAGKINEFEEAMKKNIAAVKAAGADTVITSCPACDMMWRHVYPEWSKKFGITCDIKTQHYSEVVSEKLKSGEFSFPEVEGKEPVTVTWHDSCHMGRASSIYEPPRDVIKAIPHARFVEMEHNKKNGLCCGSVLSLLKEPPVAAKLGKIRLDEAVDAGAQKVLALCPCCQFQLRVSQKVKDIPVEIVDLAHFAADALGYDLPDPNPAVGQQWAVFEKMIPMMTPQGIGSLMVSIIPEIIEAMPPGMAARMRTLSHIPGGERLIRSSMATSMPKMMTGMLPKILPAIINEGIRRVPAMPDYMKDQMPKLMPSVMENLLPHMMDDVLEILADPLIEYFKTGRTNPELGQPAAAE